MACSRYGAVHLETNGHLKCLLCRSWRVCVAVCMGPCIRAAAIPLPCARPVPPAWGGDHQTLPLLAVLVRAHHTFASFVAIASPTATPLVV